MENLEILSCRTGDSAGYDRVWAQIDMDAVLFNMESMRANIREDVKIVAVLKTNGYGHGAVAIMKEMEKLPYVWGYAAATFEEAKELRENGAKKPILLLGYVFPYCYRELACLGIRPSCFREDMLEELSSAAEEEGKPILIHIALDTGMGRIGIRPDDEGLSFVRKALSTPGLIVEGMFTHFASSNSAGIIEFPEANMNLVRAGITLYGLWPSSEVSKTIVPLRPVMTLYSRIVYIKEVGPGVSVSYGGTYTTRAEKTRIATIPVGYGDGYPRSLSGKGYVLICGKKAPILGRVCMDQTMVDITHIPEAREGSLVTLIGRDQGESITMEQLGDLSGRFNYELACDINPRVPRVICGGTLG